MEIIENKVSNFQVPVSSAPAASVLSTHSASSNSNAVNSKLQPKVPKSQFHQIQITSPSDQVAPISSLNQPMPQPLSQSANSNEHSSGLENGNVTNILNSSLFNRDEKDIDMVEIMDKSGVTDAMINEYAKYALSVIHKEKLTPEEYVRLTRETVEYWKKHVNPGFLRYRKSVAEDFVSIDWYDCDKGSALFADAQGRKYIDCLGGFGIYNVGHSHPKVIAAVKTQLDKQPLHSQELLDPLRSYAAHLLTLITPPGLNCCFFTNSGTESVEACLKVAMLSTGRKHIVAAINAFHGKTLGSLATTSKAVFRAPFLPLSNVTHVPLNDIHVLRAIFASAKFTGNLIAGLILEPIQGEGGMHVCTVEYLREARKLCNDYGACLIFDEVQTGMGRTGKWWNCNYAKVAPDLMAVGKAFGGGVMPAGACIGTKKVWEKYVENPFIMTTTFGGNPLALAAFIATVQVLVDEKLIEQCAEKGSYLIEQLRLVQSKFPHLCIEVRGKGLMIGLEFVNNDVGVVYSRKMFSKNVLVSGTLINSVVVRIEPPLTITWKQIDEVVRCTLQSLSEMDAEMTEYRPSSSNRSLPPLPPPVSKL